MQQVKQQQQPEKQMNIIERLTALFSKKLKERRFPVERLSRLWIDSAISAIYKASPSSLGISHNDFSTLIQTVGEDQPVISFQQFATLSNNLDTKSCFDLVIEFAEYIIVLGESATHIEFFAEETARMRKECEQEIANEDLAKKENPAGAFKIVKGEA